jgi:formiminotetrahydrofolate cyclodeaminase
MSAVDMDAKVAAFLKVLDPADNATGGGTASAVAGAMAGALVAMVARLSVGKEGPASVPAASVPIEPEPFYRELDAEAQALSNELFEGCREDSLAFEGVRSAFRLPKHTEEDKASRSRAIQAAWIHAARVPLANAERCARVLELGACLQGRSNPNAASDLKCALYLARAGLLGCLDNVEINVPAIRDQQVATELAGRARELRETFGSELRE